MDASTTRTDYHFATPVIRSLLPGADRLNAALRSRILARRAEDPSGIARSNTGGWHSDTDMLAWAPSEAEALFRSAIGLVGPVTADTHTPKREFGFHGEMWANVSGPGHSNQTHCHTGALWSGVYYVDVGGEGAEGELVLEDPRFPANQMYMPGLVHRDDKGEPIRAQNAIRPVPGLLVLFPSWLRHSVRPYRGEGERISVALNLMVIPG